MIQDTGGGGHYSPSLHNFLKICRVDLKCYMISKINPHLALSRVKGLLDGSKCQQTRAGMIGSVYYRDHVLDPKTVL